MNTPTIRPAGLRDATHLAALVDIAGEGFASYFWSQMTEPGQSPFEVGRARARRDEGAFTWRNGHIAEVDGDVAGALVGYRIPDTADPAHFKELPPIVRPLAELEAEAPGHWYVNVLAVFPEYRGKGIGAALLHHADLIGKAVAPTRHGAHRRLAKRGRGAALRAERLPRRVAPAGGAVSGLQTRRRLGTPHQIAFLNCEGRLGLPDEPC